MMAGLPKDTQSPQQEPGEEQDLLKSWVGTGPDPLGGGGAGEQQRRDQLGIRLRLADRGGAQQIAFPTHTPRSPRTPSL